MYRVALPPLLALGLLSGLAVQQAHAADYLRGTYAGETRPQQAAPPDWGGFYVGGHGGLSSVSNTPGSLTAPTVPTSTFPGGFVLSPTPVTLPNANKMGASYGAFMGINYLWDDVVLGIEADYTHAGIKADSRVGQTTQTSGLQVLHNTQTAQARPTDWATLRGRVGYAMGMVMPYITLGMALGNVNARTFNSGSYSTAGAGGPFTPYSASGGKNGLMTGAAFGAGVEAQLMSNMFVRAEWQGVQFAHSAGRPEVMIHTGRIGAGVKF